MLIFCDFDGTVAAENVAILMLDHYVGESWRINHLPPFLSGEITPLEVMRRSFAPMRAPAVELLDFVRDRAGLRDGFTALVDLARERGWVVHVVSGGLDFYLDAFLPKGVDYTGFVSNLTDDGWQVDLPPGMDLADDEDFKVNVIRRMRRDHPGQPVIFVGDGRNDIDAAAIADRTFAVEGSLLEKLCREQRLAYTPFTSFHEVIRALTDGAAIPAIKASA